MTDYETAALGWYLWHGGLAFLAVLGITAIIEHFVGDDW